MPKSGSRERTALVLQAHIHIVGTQTRDGVLLNEGFSG